MDCGLNLGKSRGFSEKRPALTVFLGSLTPGRSNPDRRSRIGWPRAGKALAAAALPPATLLAAGFSPDLANPTPQGSVWAAIWPWGMREACVIHWSGKRGAAGDGAGGGVDSGALLRAVTGRAG